MASLAAVLLFGACSEEKKPEAPKERAFVTYTKENLKKWIDKNAINPEDFKVSRMQVVWDTDSLCVLNFRVVAENGFGGHVKKECQYLNIKMENNIYEWFDDDRKGNGVLDCSKSWAKRNLMDFYKVEYLKELDKDTTRAGKVYTNAYINAYILPSGVSSGDEGNVIYGSDDTPEVPAPSWSE